MGTVPIAGLTAEESLVAGSERLSEGLPEASKQSSLISGLSRSGKNDAPGNDGRRAQTKATTRSKAPAKAGVYFVRAICQLAPRLAASRLTAARLFERLDQSTSRGVGAGAGRTIRLASSATLGDLGTRPSPRSPPTAHPPRKGAGARRASISPDRSTVLRDRDQRHNSLGKEFSSWRRLK